MSDQPNERKRISKQSEAKKTQRYTDKPVVERCAVCQNMLEFKRPQGGFYYSSFKCAIGGFNVKKNGVCKTHFEMRKEPTL